MIAAPFLRGGSKTVTLTTTWQRVGVPTKLKGGRINVYLAIKSPGVVWCDAAQLEEAARASAFEDSQALRQ